MKTIHFRLNGKTTAGEVEDHELLPGMLRERFGLKGVKEACSIGECGACKSAYRAVNPQPLSKHDLSRAGATSPAAIASVKRRTAS
jgi:xanthine dehydrogenase iron-sulfur cluster and FAD-binding subunit A